MTQTVACLFCGLPAVTESAAAAIQMECPSCGSYEVTVGAIGRIRAGGPGRASVLEYIRRQRAAGVKSPLVDVGLVTSLATANAPPAQAH
jgi:hypothetical protein